MSDFGHIPADRTSPEIRRGNLPSVIAPHSVMGRTLRQCTGMLGAEITGGVVSLGALYYADQLAPGLTGWVRKNVVENVLRPILPLVDGIDRAFSGLWIDGYKERSHMKEKGRLQEYARNLVNYGGSFAAGAGAKLLVRDGLNHALGAPMTQKHGWMLFGLDEGIHVGAVVLMDTALAKHTKNWEDGLSCLLQKAFNMDEKRAQELSTYLVVYEAPNALAFLASCGYITKINRALHL